MRKATRTIMAAFAAAALAVSLGACSAQPGVAARVGDQVWTEKDIDAGIAQFQEMTGQDISRQGVVWRLAMAPAHLKAVEGTQLHLDDTELRSLLEQAVQQGMIRTVPDTLDPVAATLFRTTLVDLAVQEGSLSKAELHQRAVQFWAESGLEVNPRYGSLDPSGQALLPPVFGDVVAVPSS